MRVRPFAAPFRHHGQAPTPQPPPPEVGLPFFRTPPLSPHAAYRARLGLPTIQPMLPQRSPIFHAISRLRRQALENQSPYL
jgi:hypothetical protein